LVLLKPQTAQFYLQAQQVHEKHKTNCLDRIASYEFRSDTLLDSIGVTYRRIDGSTYNSIKCGGNGGTPVSFPLSIGENIVSFTIKYDTFGIGKVFSFKLT
jgi:hypothetical protein